MKRTIFFIAVFFSAYSAERLYAQTSQDSDSYILKRINASNWDNSGINCIWNFLHSPLMEEEIPITYKTVCDSNHVFIKILPYSIYHYKVQGDTLLTTGYENCKMSMVYNQPIEEYVHSLNYNDSLSGYVLGKGRYCEEVPYRLYGHYKLKYDATGTLILPEGDTIEHVRRIKHELDASYENVRNFEQLDTSFVSSSTIPHYLEMAQSHIKQTIYKWYSKDSSIPIIEAYCQNTYKDKESIESDTLLYYNPDLLSTFVENRKEQRRISEGKRTQSVTKTNNTLEKSISYVVFPQKDKHIRIECNVKKENTPISWGLYTIDGVVLYECEKQNYAKGLYVETIKLPHCNHKTIVFRLQTGSEEFTEKIILK